MPREGDVIHLLKKEYEHFCSYSFLHALPRTRRVWKSVVQ